MAATLWGWGNLFHFIMKMFVTLLHNINTSPLDFRTLRFDRETIFSSHICLPICWWKLMVIFKVIQAYKTGLVWEGCLSRICQFPLTCQICMLFKLLNSYLLLYPILKSRIILLDTVHNSVRHSWAKCLL